MTSSRESDRLHDLRAVTDATLNRLNRDDLLVELLERVRSILDADTAAVLLREGKDADHLVARAACGLEDEVRQGVRVPMGSGFAGRIAMSRAPALLDQVDSTTVANPILWEKGVRKMLGVPLLGGHDVIGVLHVGRLEDRPFNGGDTELLQVVAERVSVTIVSQRLAVEAAAAQLLERGLQPSSLPQPPGLQLAARYVSAESRLIGGDWYDAFTVPSGKLWLVVGDVAGHGLEAAVVMGRVKSALRAYTLHCDTAAEVLERTDHKVQHFEMGALITAVCAVAAPPYDRFEISSAGHPPPVIARPGEPTDFVPVTPAPPLGAVPDVRRVSTVVDLTENAALVFYTDGLIEDRDQSIDEGLHRLLNTVSAADPVTVCQTVMGRLVGGRVAEDDVAVLAVRRTDHPHPVPSRHG